MLPNLTTAQKAPAFVLCALIVYLVAVALGRLLKRRAGVQLGVAYQLLCIALALFVPLGLLQLNVVADPFDLRRDLGAMLALLGSLFLVALLERYLWEAHFEQRRRTEIPKFLRQVVALLIVVIVALLVLSIGYGQTVPGLLAGSGIAAIVLGFAMQDLLGNIIAGVALHVGKPFKHGDWLKIENQFAEVMEINWRSTRLRTNDHIYFDIPNGQIVKNTIINLNYPTPIYAMRLRVAVEYKVPPNTVKDVLRHAASSARGILETPPPKVFLVEFGESAIFYEVKFWLNDHSRYNEACDSIRTHIWYELHRHKIAIPYPARTLHIERTRRGEEAPVVPEPTRAALRHNPFFTCMSPAEMEKLLDAARVLQFGAEERIIEQGADGASMFVLARGSARVRVDADGAMRDVATLHAGDCFGEMSLLTGEARSATVIAECDCEVMEIDKPAFAELLERNQEMLQRFSELLARRRMETEGVLAASMAGAQVLEKQREYSATFLAKLYRFFEL